MSNEFFVELETTLYNFCAVDINGQMISFDEYAGKIVLIVNTASKCGFTPQYEGLERLYEKFKGNDFVILGFPCNQFANQEPEPEDEIQAHCLTKYNVSFPMFSKIDVNGRDTHVLYKWLKKELPGFAGGMIKWNFTKFLIGKDGKPIQRFGSITTPEKIEHYLREHHLID